MATVPNWIAKGYVHSPSTNMPGSVYPITSWRPTTTQVVITAKGLRGELRFRLENLKAIGHRNDLTAPMALVSPDDPRVTKAKAYATKSAAVNALKSAMDERFFASTETEDLVLIIGRIQRAATKALADLADLL